MNGNTSFSAAWAEAEARKQEQEREWDPDPAVAVLEAGGRRVKVALSPEGSLLITGRGVWYATQLYLKGRLRVKLQAQR